MEVKKITDIKGVKIGNAQNFTAATGCTVILCEQGATAGVDVRGGAPGTRETDLLKSEFICNNFVIKLLYFFANIILTLRSNKRSAVCL